MSVKYQCHYRQRYNLSQSIQNIVVYVLIITFAIILYTAIVFNIAYKFGLQMDVKNISKR